MSKPAKNRFKKRYTYFFIVDNGTTNVRLLVGSGISKFAHMQEFGKAVSKFGVECKVVNDREIIDGFPSKKILKWYQSMRRFDRLIDDFKPDVVLVDRQRHFGTAALKRKLPTIIYLIGNAWHELEMARRTTHKLFPKNLALDELEKLVRINFDGARIIMPISKYLEDIVREKFPNKPIHTLYGGIDPYIWHYEEGMKLNHPCVGLVQGAVIWDKTREMFVLKKVLEKLPNITFYWAGDGVHAKEILSELQKYPNFKWLGSLDYPDKVRQFLSEIDVYALLTGLDMAPQTLKEALLMEKPAIATNVGGVPEIMEDGKSGFLVEKGNSDRIVEKIICLFEDKENARQMGSYGRALTLKNFSWDNIAKKFVKDVKSELNLS